MGNFLRRFIVTGLGTGYLPVAPGTWGSLGTVAVFLAAALASSGSAWATNGALVGVLLLASIGCIALGRFAESAFGKKDPRRCTLDEWAGQALALLFLPLGEVWVDWVVAVAVGFLYFRVLDILKPSPARRLEELPRGWGVLAHDLAAGIYANVAAQVSLRWCYYGL